MSYRAAVAAFVSLLLIAFFWLVSYTATFFLLAFGGILFGVLLSALSHLVSRKTNIRYHIALLFVMLLLVVIIGGTIWLLVPTVSQQAEELSQSLPKALERLKTNLAQSGLGRKLLPGWPAKSSTLLSSQKDIWSQVTGVVSSSLGILANILIVLITGIYLAANPGSYRRGFVKLFSLVYRGRLEQVLIQCYHTLCNWLLSRFISMVVVGVTTGRFYLTSFSCFDFPPAHHLNLKQH